MSIPGPVHRMSSITIVSAIAGNLPSFTEEELGDFLIERLNECGLSADSMSSIETMENGAVMECISNEGCKNFEVLNGVLFKGTPLMFTIPPAPNTVVSEKDDSHGSDMNPAKCSILTGDLPEIPSSTDLAKRAALKTGFRSTMTCVGDWSDADTDNLIKQLLLRKAVLFGRKKMPPGLWRDISNALWLENCNRSPESCRKREQILDKFFSKVHVKNGLIGNQRWRFYDGMLMMNEMVSSNATGILSFPTHSNIDVNIINTGADAECEQPIEDHPENASDAQQLEGQGNTLVLLQLYAERKERFDNPTGPGNRHDQLYNEIANCMCVEHNVVITGAEVRTKIAALLAEFKLYKEKATTSGAGAVHWEYYDIMHNIFGDGVNITPLVTASVGASSSYRKKSHAAYAENSFCRNKENNTPQRTGRTRPAFTETSIRPRVNSQKKVFRSPLTELKERQILMQERMLKEFQLMRREVARRNDAYFSLLGQRDSSS